jgi:hypothetical protein
MKSLKITLKITKIYDTICSLQTLEDFILEPEDNKL